METRQRRINDLDEAEWELRKGQETTLQNSSSLSYLCFGHSLPPGLEIPETVLLFI